MSETAFRRAQMGQEATRGTAVAADIVLVDGILTGNPDYKFSVPEEDRNSLAQLHRRTLIQQEAALTWEGPCNFEDVIHWLLMAVKDTTATQPDVGGNPTVYLWDFIPRLNTANAPISYTVEWGDNTQELEAEFVMAKSVTFKFAMGEPVRVSVEMFGRNLAKSTFTASLVAGAKEEAISTKAQVWIDSTWATLGTTLKSNFLRSAEITIPGPMPYRTASGGNPYYSTYVEPRRTASVKLAFVANADGWTEYDAMASLAGTLRAIRIKVNGSLISGAYYKYLEFDLLCRYDEPPEMFVDDEGKTTIVITAHTYDDHTDNDAAAGTSGGKFGNTEGNDFAIEVQNTVATS